jgi:hypothetical protein
MEPRTCLSAVALPSLVSDSNLVLGKWPEAGKTASAGVQVTPEISQLNALLLYDAHHELGD